MLVRTEKAFYYAASIWRDNKRVLRQGTINAEDESEAIERVHEMAKAVWKRTCFEVTIMDPVSGEVLGTSKVGDSVKAAVGQELETKEEANGFVPWNTPVPRSFSPIDIGTMFVPERFNKLTGFKS